MKQNADIIGGDNRKKKKMSVSSGASREEREKNWLPRCLWLCPLLVTKTDPSEQSKLSIIRQPHGVGEGGTVQGAEEKEKEVRRRKDGIKVRYELSDGDEDGMRGVSAEM